MELSIYVFHPDDTSLLVEELFDLDEAIALCHDLVAVDGYVRAEVWNEAGERLYGIGCTGGGLHTYHDPVRPGPPPVRLSAPPQPRVPDARATPRQGAVDAAPEAGGSGNTPGASAATSTTSIDSDRRPRFLGDTGDVPASWLGL